MYDNPLNPIYEGSGGGGTSNSSRGGGVVYIECAIQLVLDGKIDSSAYSFAKKNVYDGGSSGGTI